MTDTYSKNSENDKVAIVLGPPRSGTSMTAGILSRLGVDMGNIRPPDHQNPTGYYEDKDFLRLIMRIFESAEPGSNGFYPPKYKSILKQKKIFESVIRDLIERRKYGKKSEFWGWKATGTCLMMDLFTEHLPNPYIIIVVRNSLDIAISSVRYTKAKNKLYKEITFLEALKLANYYYDSTYSFLSANPKLNWFLLSYESILRNPKRKIYELSEFLKLPTSYEKRSNAKKNVSSPNRISFYRLRAKLLAFFKRKIRKLKVDF